MIPARLVADKVSVVALLGLYGIEVSDTSDTQIRCPWHADSTPSARVYMQGNCIVCFTCAKRFNSLDVFMHFESQKKGRPVRLREAIETLAERYGITSQANSVESSYARVRSALLADPVDDRDRLELEFIKLYQRTPRWWDNDTVLKQFVLLDSGMEPTMQWLSDVRKALSEA